MQNCRDGKQIRGLPWAGDGDRVFAAKGPEKTLK